MLSEERIGIEERRRWVHLRKATRRVERRMIANAVFIRVARHLPLPLLLALVLPLLPRLGTQVAWQVNLLGGLVCLPLVVAVFRVLLRSRQPEKSSLALDRYHGLAGRLTNALVFFRLPQSKQSAWTRLAIVDGLASTDELCPSGAAPLHWPRHGRVSVVLALLVGVELLTVELWPVPAPSSQPSVAAESLPEMLGNDDLDLLRQAMDSMRTQQLDATTAHALKQYRAVIAAVAERSIDREQLFRRLAAVDKSLSNNNENRGAVQEGLTAVAQALSRSSLARRIAEALKDNRLQDAGREMRQLAEELKSSSAVGSVERKQLARALKSASEQSKGRLKRLDATRRKLSQKRRRLLKKKRDSAAELPASQRKQLAQHERRLKRLNRQTTRAQRSQRALSPLDRELAAAAQNLLREMGESARHLLEGADNVEQLAQQEMTRKQKQELKKQLERMRELVRKAGQGGNKQRRRLEKFSRRARGKTGKEGESGRTESIPRGGKKITPGVLVPQASAGAELQSAGKSSSGQTSGGSGENAGSGKSTNPLLGEESKLAGRTRGVHAAALDTGSGMASSEVVYAAAERGFASGGYQKIYTDYQTVAEEVLDKQGIPPGYEQSVRRYFQLIRPRASQ